MEAVGHAHHLPKNVVRYGRNADGAERRALWTRSDGVDHRREQPLVDTKLRRHPVVDEEDAVLLHPEVDGPPEPFQIVPVADQRDDDGLDQKTRASGEKAPQRIPDGCVFDGPRRQDAHDDTTRHVAPWNFVG